MPILHSIKLLDIQYHKDLIHNPYFIWAPNIDRLLVWNACYPIIFNNEKRSIWCWKNSVKINVRLYNLMSHDIELIENKSSYEFGWDVCDEIRCYEIIWKNIIQQWKCPYFVLMYTYYFGKNTGIDLLKIKNKFLNYDVNKKINLKNMNEKIIKESEKKIEKLKQINKALDNDNKVFNISGGWGWNDENKLNNALRKLLNQNHYAFVITESPSHNF